MRAWSLLVCLFVPSIACAVTGVPSASSTILVPPPPALPLPGPPSAGTFTSPVPPDVDLPPLPILTDQAARLEAHRIKAALRAEVPHVVIASARRRATMVALARGEIERSGQAINRPQLLVVVDRNPSVQLLQLVVAFPDAPWEAIGGTRVSTGQTGRKFYYITPTGVFENTDAILGYRAQGTFNEHHIRGNGLKGMRVWDFGWQEAVKGWLANHQTGQIRLEVHATDPHLLEARIGRPASEGCIRVSSVMNRFLDLHGVLDVQYERAATGNSGFRALLLPDRRPTPLAGDKLVVVDSGSART